VRLTLLGTGTSFGVPQIGCSCAVCRSGDPRDRRTRTAALLRAGATTLLIDSPPELRLQLVREGVGNVDAVLYTHEHADHVSGIDDLRIFSLRRRAPLPVHGPAATLAFLETSFRYIFDDGTEVPAGTSKPRLSLHPVEAGAAFPIGEVEVLPLTVEHGFSTVFGYRMGPVAYLTDVKSLPNATVQGLAGVKVLVLGALWWRPHPTHQSIDEAVAVARDIGAERTYLTHLSHETAHRDLLARLPAGIEPGFDGLTVEVSA